MDERLRFVARLLEGETSPVVAAIDLNRMKAATDTSDPTPAFPQGWGSFVRTKD